MNRRPRGDGSVFKEGEVWVARVELPVGSDGKRRRRRRQARTKTEAVKALRQLQRELEAGPGHGSSGSRTVGQAVDAYLAHQSNGTRSMATVAKEQWLAGLVAEGLGTRLIAELTVPDCDDFLAGVAAGRFGQRPIGPDGVRRARRVLV